MLIYWPYTLEIFTRETTNQVEVALLRLTTYHNINPSSLFQLRNISSPAALSWTITGIMKNWVTWPKKSSLVCNAYLYRTCMLTALLRYNQAQRCLQSSFKSFSLRSWYTVPPKAPSAMSHSHNYSWQNKSLKSRCVLKMFYRMFSGFSSETSSSKALSPSLGYSNSCHK